MSCTLFSAGRNSRIFVGYNFDWLSGGGSVHFIPPRGERFGYVLTEKFGKGLPYEGMNEKGLFIGQTAVPVMKTGISLSRRWIVSTGIINAIMKKCATVGEAVAVFYRYNIIFGTLLGFPQLHFLAADADGDSAIIEYIRGDMKVVRKTGAFQVMTNYYVTEPGIAWPDPVPGCGGYDRFAAVTSMLGGAEDLSPERCRVMLAAASVTGWRYGGYTYNTLWSSVHDLTRRETVIYYKKNYAHPIFFSLGEEIRKGYKKYRLASL